MKKIDFILIQLKKLTNSKNDKELCKKLDINYSTLDTWKNKDKIPDKRIAEFAHKLSVPIEILDTAFPKSDSGSLLEISAKRVNMDPDELIKMLTNTQAEMKNAQNEILFKNLDDDVLGILKTASTMLKNNDKKESFKKCIKSWIVQNL